AGTFQGYTRPLDRHSLHNPSYTFSHEGRGKVTPIQHAAPVQKGCRCKAPAALTVALPVTQAVKKLRSAQGTAWHASPARCPVVARHNGKRDFASGVGKSKGKYKELRYAKRSAIYPSPPG